MNKEDPFSAQVVQEAAKKVLLPPEEVLMWFHHLDTIAKVRKNAAIKAAVLVNRMLKRSNHNLSSNLTVVFAEKYTTTVENQTWFHFECVGISKELIPEHYSCDNCC